MRMPCRSVCRLLLVVAFCCVCCCAEAAPPEMWEDEFGTVLEDLTGEDDGVVEIAVSFPLPYGGNNYTSVWIGTNGAIALGGLGEADDYPSTDEFIATTDPMIAPFWSDMDLGTQGLVFANDQGDRLIVTWDGIGSYEDEEASFTFQLQVSDDGTVRFLYNGIAGVDSSVIDTDVHVGLTEGNLGEFPPEADYSAAPFASPDTVLEIFEIDSFFDLDRRTVTFAPAAGGGYDLTVSDAPVAPRPPIWEEDYGAELATLTGGDDETEQVAISFPFAYGGNTYTSLYVGTNGALAFGGLGEADDYPSSDEFAATSNAMAAVFWSDMNLNSQGRILFKDFGDRAVITWDGIGSYASELSEFTFQAQLWDDGTIVFGYWGIAGTAYVDVDSHVGLTEGNLGVTPPSRDYSMEMPFLSGDTVVEVFPIGGEFDLESSNLVFLPQSGGGYLVTSAVPGAGFRLTEIRLVTGGVEIEWESAPGADYVVRYKESLGGSWTEIATVPSAGATTSYPHVGTLDASGFYQVGKEE